MTNEIRASEKRGTPLRAYYAAMRSLLHSIPGLTSQDTYGPDREGCNLFQHLALSPVLVSLKKLGAAVGSRRAFTDCTGHCHTVD